MSRWFIVAILIACPTLRETVAAEPVDPRRPPAITTQDVPPVPNEIFAKLRAYQNIRSAQFAGWCRDGWGMLVLTRFGNTAQLHRVYEPGGRREQLTFFDEPVTSARHVRGIPEDEILFTMSSGGNENDQIYRLNAIFPDIRLLTDGTSRNLLGPSSRYGERMVVHSNARNGRDMDLYIASAKTGRRQEVVLQTDGEVWTAQDWEHLPERRLLISRYVSINEGYAALLDVVTKEKVDIPLGAKPGQKVAVGEMRFAPDGKSAYIVHDGASEFGRLYRIDLTTFVQTALSPDFQEEVTDVDVSPSTGDVAYVTSSDGYSRLCWLPGGRGSFKGLSLPRGIVGNLKFSRDGKRLGFTFSRPRQPADAYSIDLADEELTQWTFSEVGGLKAGEFIEPEMVRFRSFDERQISAFYYRPRNVDAQRPAPVIISIHGGPESQSRPDFSSLAQMYTQELGAAVIYPNVRGSAGFGKTFLQLDNGKLREDSVKDIGALLDWIATRPELDAKRVAVVGGSYGGYMVLASLTHFGDRIRAGIDHVGIANWISFLEKTSPYRQDLRRAEYGDERDPEMRKFLQEISPLTRADRITSALLVAHGTNDPRVPFGEAQQIADKVRSLGRPVWTVYADNEGHGFAKKANRDYMQGVEFLFLQKYLAP
jgi:dipeptidyl aminopeptidase/acylaminoacyl peptidase